MKREKNENRKFSQLNSAAACSLDKKRKSAEMKSFHIKAKALEINSL